MARTRLKLHSTTPRLHVRHTTVTDAITELTRLTSRDRHLLSLLAEHHILTTDQIRRIAFTSDTTTRHRLHQLTERGVLARFRRHTFPGSQAWRYTLGPLGSTLHAAATGTSLPRPSRVTDTILALAESPKLDHLLQINEFYVSLIHYARTHPGRELTQWWSERKATAACGAIARPDGYGQWSEHHDGHRRTVGFFLELDRGTEALHRLIDKIDAYRQLATAGIHRPVLFLLPTTARELNLSARIASGPAATSRLLVATAARDHLDATNTNPADAIWLPVGARQRCRLVSITPAAASGPASGWADA